MELTIYTGRDTNRYLLFANVATLTAKQNSANSLMLTNEVGKMSATVQISYPEHRYHDEAAQSFVLDTSNEASVTSDNKTAFVRTGLEAVAVSALLNSLTVSSKSAAALVTLDQEEITINRRN